MFSLSLRWVLYEKPNFKGEKIPLDEGDIETLSYPFDTPDEAHEQNGQTQNGETNQEPKTKKFVIGSIRRAVRVRNINITSLKNMLCCFSTVLLQEWVYWI